MEGEERRSQRSLKDISYLFLSSVENKRVPPHLPGTTCLVACLDPERECSLEINYRFASAVEPRLSKVVLLDFHHSQEELDHSYSRLTRSIVFRAVDPTQDWPEILREEEGDLFLMDLSWNFPPVSESVIDSLDGLVLVMKPSLASVKSAFRLLKSIKHLRDENIYAKWEVTSPDLTLLASQWNELVRRFLGQEVIWFEDFQRVLEKMKGNRSDRPFESHLAPHDFLNSPTVPNPFFERGRLSQEEIEAFLTLAYQRESSASQGY